MTFEILYDRWVGGGICAFDFLNVIKNVIEKMRVLAYDRLGPNK